jgi:hypothetical protein
MNGKESEMRRGWRDRAWAMARTALETLDVC